jgi:hypothetical protein
MVSREQLEKIEAYLRSAQAARRRAALTREEATRRYYTELAKTWEMLALSECQTVAPEPSATKNRPSLSQ